MIPQWIVLSGRDFLLAETVHGVVESQIAAHDYRHEGYYARRIPLGDSEFALYVCPGLTRLPRCCQVRPMSLVEGNQFEVRDGSPPAQRRISYRRRLKDLGRIQKLGDFPSAKSSGNAVKGG